MFAWFPFCQVNDDIGIYKRNGVLTVTELGRKIGDLKNIVESYELNLPLCVLKVRKIEVDFF